MSIPAVTDSRGHGTITTEDGLITVDATAVIAVCLAPPQLMQRHAWIVYAMTRHDVTITLDNVDAPDGTRGGEPEATALRKYEHVREQFLRTRQ